MKTILRTITALALFTWGTALIIIVLGEIDEGATMLEFEKVLLLKAMAVTSGYALAKAAAWCYRNGWLPEYLTMRIDEIEKEED